MNNLYNKIKKIKKINTTVLMYREVLCPKFNRIKFQIKILPVDTVA